MSSAQETLDQLKTMFDDKIKQHGASGEGVGWKNTEAQQARYAQVLHLFADKNEAFRIIDYGCGAGALSEYILSHGYNATYTGYDMTPASIVEAKRVYGHLPNVSFTDDENTLQKGDYVIGCGLFSMRLDTPDEVWEQHVHRTIDKLWSLSTKGIVFNSLTSYSDPQYMRPELYYPDPLALFDYCKKHISRNVALYHDYDLYDFTIVVRPTAL